MHGQCLAESWREAAVCPLMNLDDIQPLLCCLIHSVALALPTLRTGTPSKSPRLGVRVAPTTGRRPAGLSGRCPWPGPRQGLCPQWPPAPRPTRRTAAQAGVPVPCSGWSGHWGCFRAHLPADALTLSAPIIIQSALLSAAIS